MTGIIEFLEHNISKNVWGIVALVGVGLIWFLVKHFRAKSQRSGGRGYEDEWNEKAKRDQYPPVRPIPPTTGTDKKLEAISGSLKKFEDRMNVQTQDILKRIVEMNQDLDEVRQGVKRLNNLQGPRNPAAMPLGGGGRFAQSRGSQARTINHQGSGSRDRNYLQQRPAVVQRQSTRNQELRSVQYCGHPEK